MRIPDILRLLRLLLGRGSITRTDWNSSTRNVQVAMPDGQVLDRVHVIAQAGLASRPRLGSEAVVVSVGGDRSHVVVIGTLDRQNPGPDLEEGEVAIFAAGGAVVTCRLDGTVEVTGDVSVSGKVVAEGGLEDAEGSLADLRNAYRTHTHVTAGATSTPPSNQV